MAPLLRSTGVSNYWRWAAVTAAGVLLLSMLSGVGPASAMVGGVPAATAVITEPDVAYVVRTYGVTPADAAERLARQDLAPMVEKEARRQLGTHFGGLWLDVGRDQILVGNAGGTISLDTLTSDPRLTGHVVVQPVAHSLTALEAAATDLRAHMSNSRRFAVERVDLPTNQVLVWRALHGAPEPALERYLAKRSDVVQTRNTAVLPVSKKTACQPRGDWGPVWCDVPLRGGLAIESAYADCSGGFVGKSVSDSKLYLITAGHCLNGNPSVFRTEFFNDLSVHDIGLRHSWKDNSLQDFGSISIGNPGGWRPEATVTVLAGPDTVADEHYDVPAAGPNKVGMPVCTTMGWSGSTICGTVRGLGVDAAGMTNVAQVEAPDACVSEGDSGSPVFKSHLARGILVGGTGCDYFFYQGIADALKTLHLTLLLTD